MTSAMEWHGLAQRHPRPPLAVPIPGTPASHPPSKKRLARERPSKHRFDKEERDWNLRCKVGRVLHDPARVIVIGRLDKK